MTINPNPPLCAPCMRTLGSVITTTLLALDASALTARSVSGVWHRPSAKTNGRATSAAPGALPGAPGASGAPSRPSGGGGALLRVATTGGWRRGSGAAGAGTGSGEGRGSAPLISNAASTAPAAASASAMRHAHDEGSHAAAPEAGGASGRISAGAPRPSVVAGIPPIARSLGSWLSAGGEVS